jgi:tRNA (cmo5U34)-methyltransferase
MSLDDVWDPAEYAALVRREVPDYERAQAETAAATGSGARRVLELGTGTGETTRLVLERHPDATVLGLDGSRPMLAHARSRLPADRVELRRARFEDPLPDGPFDLVVSAFAIHHLDGPGKADLFRRIAAVLAPGGRFVMADVIVPDDPADVVTPLDEGFDLPDTVADLEVWLGNAGLRPRVAWAQRDLVVFVADCEGPAR